VIFALVCSPPVLCDFCPRLFFVLDLIRFRQYLSESSQVLTNWYQESAILGQIFFSDTRFLGNPSSRNKIPGVREESREGGVRSGRRFGLHIKSVCKIFSI
jgi:hypothetical protein